MEKAWRQNLRASLKRIYLKSIPGEGTLIKKTRKKYSHFHWLNESNTEANTGSLSILMGEMESLRTFKILIRSIKI